MRKIEIIIAVSIFAVVLAVTAVFSEENKGGSILTFLSGQATQTTSHEGSDNQLVNTGEAENKEENPGQVDNTNGENNIDKEEPEYIDYNSEYLLLVNKENTLDEGYVPEKLVLPNINFIDYSDPIVRVVEEKTAKALEEMFAAAEKDGITLFGMSGYRSYNVQANLYASNVKSKGKNYASRYSAQAGASEHQSGLAMDIVSSDYKSLDTGFENTQAFKWLQENCYKYGFILRYVDGKEEITGYAYEPWHYRYVGLPHSEIITKANLTLEEYLRDH